MEIFYCQPCPEQLRICLGCCIVRSMMFQPDLVKVCILPIGEQADTISAREQLIQMYFQLCKRQVFINILAHLKGWRNIQGQFSDHPKSAQPNDGSSKLLPI